MSNLEALYGKHISKQKSYSRYGALSKREDNKNNIFSFEITCDWPENYGKFYIFDKF